MENWENPAKSRPDPGKTKQRSCKSRPKIEKANNGQRNRNRKTSGKLKELKKKKMDMGMVKNRERRD